MVKQGAIECQGKEQSVSRKKATRMKKTQMAEKGTFKETRDIRAVAICQETSCNVGEGVTTALQESVSQKE